MKSHYYTRFFFKLACILLILVSCKKEDTYDLAPSDTIKYSLTFNPEYSGTLNKNLDSTASALKFYHNSDPLNSRYQISADIGRVFINSNSNLKQIIVYSLSIEISPDSVLTVGTYSEIASTSKDLVSSFTTIDYNDRSYGWSGYSNKYAFYDSYPNSYTKVVITKIYRRHLVDGIHTYASGSIDATMLSTFTTDLNGYPLSIFESQLHFKCAFDGAEIFD